MTGNLRSTTTRPRRTPSSIKDGPGINHGDIADHNSRIVLELLRVFGALTRRDLSQRLGLTEPAITGILRRLQDDGRATCEALGEQIGLSASAVLRRIKKLEDAGVIDR